MIHYHHIGGRNGTFPFPLKKGNLLKDFHLILYDADRDCLEHMQENKYENFGETMVLPYCIGKEKGSAEFYITYHPAGSSLYRFNEEYKNFSSVTYPKYGEFIYGDSLKSEESVFIETFSLSELLKKKSLPIDFLSLDVQGAEYDILLGSKDVIAQSVVGIQLEIEFIELYKNQRVFSEIDRLLNSMGFELIDVNSIGRASPISLPIGFRAEEQIMYADFVYIKNFNSLIHHNDIDKMYQYALFALIHKKMGLCINMLEYIKTNNFTSKKETRYSHLLSKLLDVYKSEKNIYLPKFHQISGRNMMKSMYNSHVDEAAISKEKMNIDLFLKEKFSGFLENVKSIQNMDITPIEALLKEYDLDSLANILKHNRQDETKIYIDLISNLT